MRTGPNSRRLRSRGNGARRHGSSRSQNFESNGPDVKVRGSAQQLVEKYLQLARDAATAGDPVRAENYYQHAEHYYRLRNANGGGDRQPQRPGEQPRNGTGAGAEGETPAASAANGSDRGAAEEPEISAPGAEPAAKPEGAGDQVS